jgi:hypothetical protein
MHWFSDKELNSLQGDSNLCVCVHTRAHVHERERGGGAVTAADSD